MDAESQGLSKLEFDWLAYAADVASCDDQHLAACRAKRKPWFPSCELDDNVRWPGNLGSRYDSAPVRIFCIAQIHNDKHLYSSFRKFEDSLRALRLGTITLPEYLRVSQHDYEAVISKWGPWGRFLDMFKGTKRPVTPADVLYTNIAKCWAPAAVTGRTVDNSGALALCGARYPIRDLIAMAKPHLIVQIGAGSFGARNANDGVILHVQVHNNDRPPARQQRVEAATLIRRTFPTLF